jgi:hypothetical protein
MPGSWPEPFGLVAIEALACGAPVIARRVGGLDEIIRDGVDGFFGDDVTEMAFMVERVGTLDREAIRSSVMDRFSARRMADGYEALYARMLRLDAGHEVGRGRRVVEIAPRPREAVMAVEANPGEGPKPAAGVATEAGDEVLPDPTEATPA